MHLLVSFCAVRVPGRPVLGLLDTDSLEFSVIAVPDGAARWRDVAGLAVDEQYVYCVAQSWNQLVVLDRRDLRFRGVHTFRSLVHVHSIWSDGDVVFAVSTGTDEVFALRMRGAKVVSEEVAWRPDLSAPRNGNHHLNMIAGCRGALYVSGFGRKVGKSWASARDGFITDLTSGRIVATGLYHPHSLACWDSGIAHCESARRLVRVLGTDQAAELPGYARGLCVADGKLWAGTSAGRNILRHLRLTGRPKDPELMALSSGRCTISRLALDTLEIEETIELGAYGHEIYDLMPVENVDEWPILDEVAWRDEIIREFESHLARPPATYRSGSAASSQKVATKSPA